MTGLLRSTHETACKKQTWNALAWSAIKRRPGSRVLAPQKNWTSIQMPNEHTDFWVALLGLVEDHDRRVRLWNGYLGWKLPAKVNGKFDPKGGWPQLIVNPPNGGWPRLTDEEQVELDALAVNHGGHPELSLEYMNFSGHYFQEELDLSGLILIDADFEYARFNQKVTLSNKTHFYGLAQFSGAEFNGGLRSSGARFHADVSFSGATFESRSTFMGTEFRGGASFKNAVLRLNPMFNDSRFDVRFFAGTAMPRSLADFRNAQFPDGATFRNVRFGNDEISSTVAPAPQRSADFTDAKFGAATTFRGSTFASAPAFFNTTLHEDTEFRDVDWSRAETTNVSADYSVRAWERLELMMSRLEKPLDRHKFFRLKMRARRRTESLFLRSLNWLFEKTSDYGWGGQARIRLLAGALAHRELSPLRELVYHVHELECHCSGFGAMALCMGGARNRLRQRSRVSVSRGGRRPSRGTKSAAGTARHLRHSGSARDRRSRAWPNTAVLSLADLAQPIPPHLKTASAKCPIRPSNVPTRKCVSRCVFTRCRSSHQSGEPRADLTLYSLSFR